MRLFEKKQKEKPDAAVTVQTGRADDPLAGLAGQFPTAHGALHLYEALRESVPMIDAAIGKIVRLTGNFSVHSSDPAAERALTRFTRQVPVGSSEVGLEAFISTYLDNLLTYGNAVGEIVTTPDGRQVAGLYNASLHDLDVVQGATPMEAVIRVADGTGMSRPLPHPERVSFTALLPPAGELWGRSILQSLPFVSRVLLTIFRATEQNFERIGNLRYAVTYHPGSDATDRAYAKERATLLADEWSQGMRAARNGELRDFVAVGDVRIQAIGADSKLMDIEIPAQQMLEQIVAKLGIPPFLLGLSWSTTERMSQQQSDILTSELSYYRRLLTPVIEKVCRYYLRTLGMTAEPEIEWQYINLQDDLQTAQAELTRQRAAALEKS